MLEPNEWHKRFAIQAEWTKSIQDYLTSTLPDKNQLRAIEIGSGTGAILQRMKQNFPNLFGLDINIDYLAFSKQRQSEVQLICADGYRIPALSRSFDVVFVHYFLLWVTKPQSILGEIHRILDNGGSFLIFAEPDYGGRIDYPPALERLGKAQTESLKRQGADPYIGRKLPELLSSASFRKIQYGILGSEWDSDFNRTNWESEWEMLEHDLGNTFAETELSELKEKDFAAYKNHKRVLFVPTFFAAGKK